MADLSALESALRQRKTKYERALGEAKGVQTRLRETKAEIGTLEALQESLDEAIGVLNSFADTRSATVQSQVEGLVTEGLQAVFGDDLSFHAITSTRGKLAATDFVIRSTQNGSVVETDILDARGGGVAAVAGFLLRLILLLLRKDARPVLFLDEVFGQLSAEYEPRLAEFLRELVDRTSVQLIMVTHSDAFTDAADVVYRFKLVDGVTVVTTEKSAIDSSLKVV